MRRTRNSQSLGKIPKKNGGSHPQFSPRDMPPGKRVPMQTMRDQEKKVVGFYTRPPASFRTQSETGGRGRCDAGDGAVRGDADVSHDL